MDNQKIIKGLDEAIENFKKDMAILSEDSSEPVTEKKLYQFSVMVLKRFRRCEKSV